jgi:aryl-alcohol dehydrogenase-like predicted oxidoreductase
VTAFSALASGVLTGKYSKGIPEVSFIVWYRRISYVDDVRFAHSKARGDIV